jgi:PAS domain-containing protein
MRDEHRPKHELVHEITGLRKQVLDLKDAMIARRRVEDALRATEGLLRTLTDGAPVGLCLFRRDGTPLTANGTFARMLGYDTPAELLRIAGVLGVFANSDEKSRALKPANGCGALPVITFRSKSGGQLRRLVMAEPADGDSISLVVFDDRHPFPNPAA